MSPEAIIHGTPGKNRVKRALELALFALVLSLSVISLLILTSVLYDAYYNSPPVNIVSLDTPPKEPLCPGNSFDVHQELTITKPVLLYLYVSVMDKNMFANVIGTQTTFPPRPQPVETTFREALPWTVPPLAPGIYTRVVTLRGYRSSEKPVYSGVLFTIGEDCDDWVPSTD